LAGNPLAVVMDAGGLSAAQMQAIAIEFNYSETTFVCRRAIAPTMHRCAFLPYAPSSRSRAIPMSHRLRAGDAGAKAAGAAKV